MVNEYLHKIMDIPYNSVLYTDLDVLRDNVRSILRSLPNGCRLVPVLKDDAYGLGLEKIAGVLCEFPEITSFAVADVSEGILLRQIATQHEILIMSCALPFQLEAIVKWNLTAAAGRTGFVKELAEEARRQEKTARIQIAVDTGLHRIGLESGAPLQALLDEILSEKESIIVSGCFSHVSDGDSSLICGEAYSRFSRAVEQIAASGIQPGTRHLLASSSFEGHPEYAMDAVRLGRRLYMDHPTRPNGGVNEVSSWKCFISSLNDRNAGERLGYGGKTVLSRDSRVATISVGYGDGLNAELAAVHAPVLISGKRCPILFIMMDQAVVDVTGVDCRIGDSVTIFGWDENGASLPSQELALMIGDNEGCGLTSALSSRVAREYLH